MPPVDPFTPLLHFPTRRESPQIRRRLSTVILTAVLVLVLLNGLATARDIFSTYQVQLATTDENLAVLADDDKIVECTRWKPSPDDTFQPPPFFESSSSSQALPREKADFDLPIDAKGLLVYARGSSSSGVVRVHESLDVKDLKITVFAHYWNRRALSKAKFALHVDDLSSYSFGVLALKSANRPITVNSITGETIIAESKNAKIEGFFNVTRLLKLITTNSLINASLNAHSNLPSKPTVVFLKTSNGPIHSNTSLSTNSSSGTGGHFRVYTYTHNAPLDLTFPTSPPDSHLVLDASTKNAPAHVTLRAPAAFFEGRLLLQTTQFQPTLYVTPGVEDPAGLGRERKVRTHAVPGGCALIGNVSWVPPGKGVQADGGGGGAGWASVSTRNAPVTLVL
ncbi:hypothetical protein BGW80DRAFT_1430740 [Lactifluus volemus]|nr:hypothetical protein BGW80DRAFT_1430740 [Lactifluus volemus]